MTVDPSEENKRREEELISCLTGCIWTIIELLRGHLPEADSFEKAIGICQDYAEKHPDKIPSFFGGLATDDHERMKEADPPLTEEQVLAAMKGDSLYADPRVQRMMETMMPSSN